MHDGIVSRNLIVDQVEHLLLVNHLVRMLKKHLGRTDWASNKATKHLESVPL